MAESENIGANHLEFAKSLFQQYSQQLKLNTTTPWELSEEEEKESEDQGFTYQNPISENSEFKTPNFQTPINSNLENLENATLNIQTLQNSEQINQNNLPPNIIINQPPIDPIAKPIQQPLQLSPQQNQQPFQQPPQPSNLDPMAYAPIVKLDNFTSKEDDAQVWLNNVEKAIAANG
ncbi:hypothetical protein G9A89_019327 [Geosiphon pyriformis]|nr:hypothetical protein G9A89_019327 [Geosiphon pyriformis]